MRRMLLVLALVTSTAWAGRTKEGAATGAHAVRDSFRTLGRSTRAFFVHGTRAAKETWRENSRATAEHARHHARRTRR